jgi:hypothetical protein
VGGNYVNLNETTGWLEPDYGSKGLLMFWSMISALWRRLASFDAINRFIS